jgi:hypothetical protein
MKISETKAKGIYKIKIYNMKTKGICGNKT